MSRLFIDCDGVIADFDSFFLQITGIPSREFEQRYGSTAFWDLIRDYREPGTDRGFFECLPYMPGARALLGAVWHLDPIILTGAPFGDWAEPQKLRWRARMAPDFQMKVCLSKDKRLHMRPGDVIIDDWEQHMTKWVDAGGIWITHTSAASSIAKLIDLKPEWFQ